MGVTVESNSLKVTTATGMCYFYAPWLLTVFQNQKSLAEFDYHSRPLRVCELTQEAAPVANAVLLCVCSVADGTTNLLLANHTDMLLIYQDVALRWAAQLPFVPVAVRVASFP